MTYAAFDKPFATGTSIQPQNGLSYMLQLKQWDLSILRKKKINQLLRIPKCLLKFQTNMRCKKILKFK